MSNSLEGKVAVITGGTTGIGLAIAKEFVAEGAKVVVTALQQEALDEAVREIGPRSFGAKADASSIAEMDALLKRVKADHGRLDAVIANAVADEHAPLGKITEEQFDKMVGVNLKGVLFTIQSAMPLLESDGSIILIGSTASVAPPAGMSIYGAIKAAFHGMVRSLIQDAKDTGVRINILSPGAVDTPSLRRALIKAAGADMADAIVQSIAQRSPAGRIGDAREIGKVAVFLASDASSYVNGVELFVDGGLRQV
ncbi:Short chain dehydrogenase [Cupriavidus necator]|uniref:SDR family oxidoreductase n=1 Tax=Cupriavidus necator (strain ATCC 17699 / DSM 428 / KCTC 22496 / NCIMB 10442 / H16 / Stanier 337) TaxID=381666 RepID=Q0K0G0_CUPNH|nr:SDR family oxidoreductase [Cupriavidus necator]QCC04346.1 SDR family oxidoreductase [Cupriavidus necator H16]QQB79034.1 SDR family oxidoreductase [Cupriavidus necator]WKA43255.1 SDR family oxidoreductase [Cupriavidus necator]CAJ96514.1 short chain dehydrogenase [Cupriavidus necator H16]